MGMLPTYSVPSYEDTTGMMAPTSRKPMRSIAAAEDNIKMYHLSTSSEKTLDLIPTDYQKQTRPGAIKKLKRRLWNEQMGNIRESGGNVDFKVIQKQINENMIQNVLNQDAAFSYPKGTYLTTKQGLKEWGEILPDFHNGQPLNAFEVTIPPELKRVDVKYKTSMSFEFADSDLEFANIMGKDRSLPEIVVPSQHKLTGKLIEKDAAVFDPYYASDDQYKKLREFIDTPHISNEPVLAEARSEKYIERRELKKNLRKHTKLKSQFENHSKINEWSPEVKEHERYTLDRRTNRAREELREFDKSLSPQDRTILRQEKLADQKLSRNSRKNFNISPEVPKVPEVPKDIPKINKPPVTNKTQLSNAKKTRIANARKAKNASAAAKIANVSKAKKAAKATNNLNATRIHAPTPNELIARRNKKKKKAKAKKQKILSKKANRTKATQERKVLAKKKNIKRTQINKQTVHTKCEQVALRGLNKHSPLSRFNHASEVYSNQTVGQSFFSRVKKYTDHAEIKRDLTNYLNSGIKDSSTFTKEMEHVRGMKDTDIVQAQKNNIGGFKERVDSTLDKNKISVDHYKKTLSPEKYKQLKESLEKFENIDTTNMTMSEIKTLTKELNTTADTLLSADGAVMSNVQKAMKGPNRSRMFTQLGKTVGVAMTGFEAAKLLAIGAIKGTTKLTETVDNLSKSINKISSKEFGSGIFVSTEQYNTERGRAMEVIQTNRINAQSYLGNEAMMTSRGRL